MQQNSWIVLTAQGLSGYGFARWVDGVCDTISGDDQCTAILRNDLTVSAIFGRSPIHLNATTLQAFSCEAEDVQVAINEAQEGDTVRIPAGICTWNMTVKAGRYSHATRLSTSKALTILGAGVGKTIINDSVIAVPNIPNPALAISIEEGKSIRLSGISFDGTTSAKSYGPITISGPAISTPLFRIDHSEFLNITEKGVIVDGVYGVIDHNRFVRCASATCGNPTLISMSDYGKVSGDEAWLRPQALGTENAIYIEDNIFVHSILSNGPFDAYSGARYVFRYNTVYGANLGHHGFDSSPRGVVNFEIYNNHFQNASPDGTLFGHGIVFEFRSGSGLLFNNVVTKAPGATINAGAYDGFASLRNYRSDENFSQKAARGICDGTSVYDGNSIDQDTNGDGIFDKSSGYPCRDQIGRTSEFDPDGDQTYSPVYGWNNNFQGAVGGNLIAANYNSSQPGGGAGDSRLGTNYHILEGRDFFNDRCRPGYVPFAYPHPLIQTQDGVAAQTTSLNCPALPSPYILTIHKTGTGAGSVFTGTGARCGSICTENVGHDEGVVLTASAAPNSVFTGWSGDGSGTTNPLTLTMSNHKNIIATFAPLLPSMIPQAPSALRFSH